MPPPYFAARYGNLQIFPSPTDAPAADRTYPSLPEKLLLLLCSIFSLSPFVKYVFTIPYFHQKGFLNFRSIFMHLCKFLDDVVSDHLYSLLQIFSYYLYIFKKLMQFELLICLNIIKISFADWIEIELGLKHNKSYPIFLTG